MESSCVCGTARSSAKKISHLSKRTTSSGPDGGASSAPRQRGRQAAARHAHLEDAVAGDAGGLAADHVVAQRRRQRSHVGEGVEVGLLGHRADGVAEGVGGGFAVEVGAALKPGSGGESVARGVGDGRLLLAWVALDGWSLDSRSLGGDAEKRTRRSRYAGRRLVPCMYYPRM